MVSDAVDHDSTVSCCILELEQLEPLAGSALRSNYLKTLPLKPDYSNGWKYESNHTIATVGRRGLR